MKLLNFTRKQLFSSIISLGAIILVLSLFAQNQPANSTLPTYNLTASQTSSKSTTTPVKTDSNYPYTENKQDQDTGKIVTNTLSTTTVTMNNTDTNNPGQPVTKKNTPDPAPTPIMPRCECPLSSDETNDREVCPDDCTPPPNPTPPPHCQPCGGFRKAETDQVIACPMICME